MTNVLTEPSFWQGRSRITLPMETTKANRYAQAAEQLQTLPPEQKLFAGDVVVHRLAQANLDPTAAQDQTIVSIEAPSPEAGVALGHIVAQMEAAERAQRVQAEHQA